MKVLIVYDTVSPKKITAEVAQAISKVLKEEEIETDSFFFRDIDKAAVKNYDCVIAGSPTMYFRASSGIGQFLDSYSGKEFSGKRAAAFDTQLQLWISGNAAKGIERKLKNLGFEIIMPPLVAYVEGKMNEMQLKEGELDKARNWAREVAKSLSK